MLFNKLGLYRFFRFNSKKAKQREIEEGLYIAEE